MGNCFAGVGGFGQVAGRRPSSVGVRVATAAVAVGLGYAAYKTYQTLSKPKITVSKPGGTLIVAAKTTTKGVLIADARPRITGGGSPSDFGDWRSTAEVISNINSSSECVQIEPYGAKVSGVTSMPGDVAVTIWDKEEKTERSVLLSRWKRLDQYTAKSWGFENLIGGFGNLHPITARIYPDDETKAAHGLATGYARRRRNHWSPEIKDRIWALDLQGQVTEDLFASIYKDVTGDWPVYVLGTLGSIEGFYRSFKPEQDVFDFMASKHPALRGMFNILTKTLSSMTTLGVGAQVTDLVQSGCRAVGMRITEAFGDLGKKIVESMKALVTLGEKGKAIIVAGIELISNSPISSITSVLNESEILYAPLSRDPKWSSALGKLTGKLSTESKRLAGKLIMQNAYGLTKELSKLGGSVKLGVRTVDLWKLKRITIYYTDPPS